MSSSCPRDVHVRGPVDAAGAEILSFEAVAFVAELVRQLGPRVEERLAARIARRGQKLRFLEETADVRAGDWKVAPLPEDLLDRRVEITGPVDRKMIINALNSGASCFMADFEDSNSPTWANCLSGQVNLRDANARTIEFTNEAGKHYKLNDNPAVLLVRPRGWHLKEAHFVVDDKPAPASLVDFGFYFFHNHRLLRDRGTGPYFYLPKLENHLEARLWNEVFVHAAEGARHQAAASIKATILIETMHGRVRDGRDPLRDARAYRRPQLRPLGLHLQLYQEVGSDDRADLHPARTAARSP